MAGKRRTARGGSTGPIGAISTNVLMFCFVLAADFASTIVLYLEGHGMCQANATRHCPRSASDFWSALQTSFTTNRGTLDLCILAMSRVIFGLLAVLSTYFYANPNASTKVSANRSLPTTRSLPQRKFSINTGTADDAIESQPLLRDDTHAKRVPGDENSIPTDPSTTNMSDLARTSRLKRKMIVVGLLFLSMTAIQAYVGVKCVSYHFTNRLTTVLMCLTVAWINLELFVLKNLVDLITKEKGIDVPDLHPHAVFFVEKLPLHSCDVCDDKIKGAAYRCRSCDFDLCDKCFAKRDRSQVDGVLRGDKGIKEVTEVKTSSYALRALKFSRPHWPYIVAAVVCLLANTGANLLLPNYNGDIMDCIIDQDRARFRHTITLFVILSAATGVFGSIRQLMFRLVGSKMANTIRNNLFAKVVAQDIAFFDGAKTGDLVSRLSGDVSALVQPCQTMIGTLLSSSLQLCGGIFMCFHTSWRLSMLAFVTAENAAAPFHTVAPIMYLTDQYARWSRRLMYEYFSALGDATAKANEALNNIRTVKAFSTESQEEAAYNLSTREALTKAIIDALGSAGTFSLTNYLDLGGTVLILWYGGRLALDGDVTVGTLVAFRIYWVMINSSYKNLMTVLTSFTRAGGAAQRVLSLMDSMPDIDNNVGRKLQVHGDISLKNVEFHYQMRPKNKVLKGINLDIKRGQVCALVGKSGGGKSTIAHLLMRFYDPRAGQILIDGHDLTTLHLASLHQQCGLVAQETQLFGTTIRENICYGLGDKFESGELCEQDIIDAAVSANAHQFITMFDDGYGTMVGERGVRLSGGQKQRIALARVFLRQPKLLFLDEATSALDAESEAEVQGALDRLIARGNSTVILIAHRLSTVMDADKIAVVDDGRIAEQGTHDELIAKGGLYAKLVSKQLEKQRNQLHADVGAAHATSSGATSVDAIYDMLSSDTNETDSRVSASTTVASPDNVLSPPRDTTDTGNHVSASTAAEVPDNTRGNTYSIQTASTSASDGGGKTSAGA